MRPTLVQGTSQSMVMTLLTAPLPVAERIGYREQSAPFRHALVYGYRAAPRDYGCIAMYSL